MPVQRSYSNTGRLMSLQVAVNNSVTSIVVDDASGLPGTFPFAVALDYGAANVEIVYVSAVASNVLTVSRGEEDTAAANHSVGAVCVHVATAQDFTDFSDHYWSTSDVHGIGPAASVVGTSTIQTLTNKTMSGSLNTFTNLPAAQVTGTFPSVTTSGLITGVGLTTTGAITATGQAITSATVVTTGIITSGGAFTANAGITCSTITASGLISANNGLTIPSGKTLSLTNGSIMTIANATVTFDASTTTTFQNGMVVSGGTAIFSSGATLSMSSGATVTMAAGSTLTLNGDMTRDSATARMLMDASENYLAANTNTTGAANSVNDISGCTYTFTVPSGRTATLDAWGIFNILGVAATTSFELIANLDSTTYGSNPVLTANQAINYSISKRWIFTGLAAGSHTIKLQYKNINGSSTVQINGSQSRTALTVMIYW